MSTRRPGTRDVILLPTGPLEREHYDLIFHTLAVRNTARWSPALFGRSRTTPATTGRSRAIWRWPHPPAARSRRSWTRAIPRAAAMIVDGLLRVGPVRGGVKKVAKRPGGIDLGPLESVLPDRLQTPTKRIDPGARSADVGRRRAGRSPDVGPIWLAPDELLLIGRRHQRDNNSWLHNAPRLTFKGRAPPVVVHPDDPREAWDRGR